MKYITKAVKYSTPGRLDKKREEQLLNGTEQNAKTHINMAV